MCVMQDVCEDSETVMKSDRWIKDGGSLYIVICIESREQVEESLERRRYALDRCWMKIREC